MSDKITLTGIEAIGYHGVYPDERRDGQRFIADLTLVVDLHPAGVSDQLEDATDYSHVAQRVQAQLIGEPVNLIEKLAERVADEILMNFPKVESISVTIHKPDAPVGVTLTDISITIYRVR